MAGHFNRRNMRAEKSNKGAEINRRNIITVAGLNAKNACLYQIKLNPQINMASINAM